MQEDEILVKVSNAAKSKKWKKASEELRRLGFDRTDVECRERYARCDQDISTTSTLE
jgi:hypothetical protein